MVEEFWLLHMDHNGGEGILLSNGGGKSMLMGASILCLTINKAVVLLSS